MNRERVVTHCTTLSSLAVTVVVYRLVASAVVSAVFAVVLNIHI